MVCVAQRSNHADHGLAWLLRPCGTPQTTAPCARIIRYAYDSCCVPYAMGFMSIQMRTFEAASASTKAATNAMIARAPFASHETR